MSAQRDKPQPPSGDKEIPKHSSPASANPSTSAARAEAARTTSSPVPSHLDPENLISNVLPAVSVMLGPSEGAVPLATGASGNQPSRGAGRQRPMDLYRYYILKDICNNMQKVEIAQGWLAHDESHIERLMSAYHVIQYRRRAMFMLKESTERIKRLQDEFDVSYSPLLRDVAGQQGAYYAAAIQQIFQKEPVPSKRLQMFQARLTSLDANSPVQNLRCQYQLVIDEERRELSCTGPSKAPNVSTEIGQAVPASQAEGGGAAQASGSADAGPSDPSRRRHILERPTHGRPVEGSAPHATLCGSGATPPAPAAAARTGGPSHTTSPSSSSSSSFSSSARFPRGSGSRTQRRSEISTEHRLAVERKGGAAPQKSAGLGKKINKRS